MPLNGSAIECRAAGALPGGAVGDYQLVFDFANSVSSATASVVAGAGTVTNQSVQGGDYVVNLSGVTNAQRITVRLSNVTDSAGHTLASLDVTMGVLIGDVNSSKNVDGNDVSAVQAKTRQAVNSSTFKFDVNATGSIDGNDVSLTQSKTRTSLP